MKKNDIKEVARRTGVSPSTVSRAINHPEMVNEKTREKVLEVVDHLNYHASSSARGLKGFGSGLILVSFGDSYSLISSSNYYQALIPMLVEKFEKQNYHLIMSMHMHDTDLSSIITLSRKNVFDLTILLAPRKDDERLIQLKKMREKFLVLGSPTLDFDYNYVESDSYAGSRMAVETLVDSGYENFIFVGMEDTYDVSKVRYEGFLDTVRHTRCSYKAYKNCQPLEKSGYEIGKEVSLDERTGVFCTADIFAVGFMKAQYEKGKLPGRDYGIVGYDALIEGITLGNSHYSLTSVRQDLSLTSDKVVEQCIRIINDQETENVILPVKIKMGDTL
ncbi:MAG TPA: LacI family DNA-binding transcriptional regulator [Thermotogota bacterium]|nr:LacI family DNA-binding transcriptional regulator [Thermotogota bacterium]HPJ89491.1 LacI family DNA-binding transcriptional regulator [Thermotogota bacterium]HPR96383.1 LacI family DNA-binding transcriptional regulator [Thermotogota bacterium]